MKIIITMAWKAEPVKHFIDIAYFRKGEEINRTYSEYTPGQYHSKVPVTLNSEDEELRVKPYTIEHLGKVLTRSRRKGRTRDLFAGIKNGFQILYLGKLYMDSQANFQHVRAYYFENDRICSCRSTIFQGPVDDLFLGELGQQGLIQHFEELKSIRPEVSESLDKCVRLVFPSALESLTK